MVSKINFHYPIFDRSFNFNTEELTPLELVGRTAQKVNEVVDSVNDVQNKIDVLYGQNSLVGNSVNVKHHGAMGDGIADDTESINKAVAIAKTIGSTVYFPSGHYIVNNPDFQGVGLSGNGTANLKGTIKNSGFIDGVLYNDLNVNKVLKGSIPVTPVNNKIIVKYDDDSFYVFTKNPRNSSGYVGIRMRSASGQGLPPWELVRQREVYDLWNAFAYIDCRDSTQSDGGNWENYNFQSSSVGAPPMTGHGDPPKYIVGLRSSTQGAYLEKTVTPDNDGYINVMLLGTTSTPDEVQIYVDGELKDTFNSKTKSNQLITRTIYVGFRDVVVRVQKASQFGILYVAGFQVHRPDEAKPEIPYTDWANYRLPNGYVSHHGANEYAFYDLDLDRFVGSGHGEEYALQPYQWYIDGEAVTLEDHKPKVGLQFSIAQRTGIANKLITRSMHIFRNDATVEKIISIDGQMRTDRTYFGMNSANENFTEVEFPIRIENVSGELQDHFLGLTDTVIQRNPSTDQRIYTRLTISEGWNNARGGVFIKSDTKERFKKVYSGLNIESENIFKGDTKQIIHVFA